MKLGAEPKKVAILGGLLAIAAVVLYINVFSSDSEPAPAHSVPVAPTSTRPVVSKSAPPAAASASRGGRSAQAVQRSTSNRAAGTAWNLRLGNKNPEDRPDPASIDPTLHMELLARVQSVEVGPQGRNLFVFGVPPPPPAASVTLPTGVKPIPVKPLPGSSGPQPATAAAPPSAPQAPQMTFKYYGFKVSKSDGHKAAFLLDGDDILIAGENDTMKSRYKVVKIGVNSITIEDTQYKSRQTLPLQENLAG